jgi:NhaP-type Na+/H+ and K+/H+ antiporter
MEGDKGMNDDFSVAFSMFGVFIGMGFATFIIGSVQKQELLQNIGVVSILVLFGGLFVYAKAYKSGFDDARKKP